MKLSAEELENRLRESKDFWNSRSAMREVRAEVKGVQIMGDVLKIYDGALENIRKEINNVYLNYSNKTGLDVAELSKILDGVDRNKYVRSIAINMKRRGLKLEDVFDKGYIKRLTRLEAIKQQIYWEIQGLAPRIGAVESMGFRDLISDSYKVAKTDLRRQIGGDSSFMDLGKERVNKILDTNWMLGNYYGRTFDNIDGFGERVKVIIGSGMAIGMSQEKMAKQIEERFDVAKYDAMRLIRTESNYFHNVSELESYKDEGVMYYRLMVMMDNRTSDICRTLGGYGLIYKVEDAIPGETFPPFHPNCRTTTLIVFPNEVGESKIYNGSYGKEVKIDEGFRDSFREVYETQMKGLESEGYDRSRMEDKMYEPIVIGSKYKTEIKLEPYYRNYMEEGNIRVVDRGTSHFTGQYRPIDNEIYVKNTSDKVQMEKSFFHELGHYVDSRNVIKTNWGKYNQSYEIDSYHSKDEFKNVWLSDGSWSNETRGIAKERARTNTSRWSLSEEQLDNYMKGLKVFVKDKAYLKMTKHYENYIHSDEEIFADGFALYKLRPDRLKELAPRFYKYFDEVDNLFRKDYG